MALSHVIIICLSLLRRNLSETLTNPTNEQEHHCGINEDCTIICNEAFSCMGSTFYVYNNSINIECSANLCGYFSTFISKNAASISITATGDSALWFAEVIIDSPNTDVYTHCSADDPTTSAGEACRWTSFYYRTQGTVQHICAGDQGCTGAQIHAMSAIELHCIGSQSACKHLSVIWPIDAGEMQKSKMINYVKNNDITMYLYLGNTQIAPNITCVESCDTFEIAIIYGTKFDEMCLFGDSLCIPQILSYEDTFDISSFNMDYYPSYRNGDYTFSKNTILSIHRYDSSWNYIFVNHSALPTYINFISDNDAFVSILCTECNEMTLNFSSISNAAITAVDTAQFFIVDGPKNSITTNIVYGSATIYNVKYYLQNTKSVTFRGLPKLYPAECGSYDSFCGSEIFLSDQTDVNILGFLRKEDHCCIGDQNETSVTVFSDVGSNTGALVNNGWNIECDSEDITNNCVQFKLNHPTLNPTRQPTFAPSKRTLRPIVMPSVAPIMDGKVIEYYTTIDDNDESHDTIIVNQTHKSGNEKLYLIISILAVAFVIVLIAFAFYVFRNKNTHKSARKMSTRLDTLELGMTKVSEGNVMSAGDDRGVDTVSAPLAMTAGEEENVVPGSDEDNGGENDPADIDEDEEDEDPDLELLYNRVVSSTKS